MLTKMLMKNKHHCGTMVLTIYTGVRILHPLPKLRSL
nr:MAG TPA: hypothetical protein [Caudoviricetes sp.]DAL74790.1 MAG TPA: hypothetical protein [Caudoviricetes sp.]